MNHFIIHLHIGPSASEWVAQDTGVRIRLLATRDIPGGWNITLGRRCLSDLGPWGQLNNAIIREPTQTITLTVTHYKEAWVKPITREEAVMILFGANS